jgi:hypothetical protein
MSEESRRCAWRRGIVRGDAIGRLCGPAKKAWRGDKPDGKLPVPLCLSPGLHAPVDGRNQAMGFVASFLISSEV